MKEINNVIELKNVVKDYGDFKLNHISFGVPEGSVCGFIGQNGAGKTTTINLILDIINRDEGEINLFGKPVDKDHAYVREDVGVVFDEMGFHEFMTAKDINIMMKNIYKNWDEVAFFDYLKKFSLPSKKKCGAFSRGMRMKLQIAVAMSHKAKLLIMDEYSGILWWKRTIRFCSHHILRETLKRLPMRWFLLTVERSYFPETKMRFSKNMGYLSAKKKKPPK